MDFVRIAKPWLVLANLLTAAAGYLLAARGHFQAGVFVAVLAGVGLFVACGCVLNNCLDRNLDRDMARTRGRVLPSGSMTVGTAVWYALGLGLAGTLVLLGGTSRLPLGIVLAGLVVYVGVYTAWLKRTSPWSTVVGSLAGAAPPLAAYCAGSGRFDLGAGLVLALFSLWQIPHSYAITLVRLDDYGQAAVPVMPRVHGVAVTKKHLLWHIAACLPAALALSLCGYTGRLYAVVAVVSGLGWLGAACPGYAAADARPWARRLYCVSLVVIVCLSIAMAVDAVAAGLPHLPGV